MPGPGTGKLRLALRFPAWRVTYRWNDYDHPEIKSYLLFRDSDPDCFAHPFCRTPLLRAGEIKPLPGGSLRVVP